MADDALVDGAAGLQVRLCRIECRDRLGTPGPRLRDVGARDLADGPPGLGGMELGGQHRDVVLAQPHQRLIADHVDIGGDRLEQGGALDLSQVLATGADHGLGLGHGVDGAKAVEDLLRHAEAVAGRVGITADAGRGLRRRALSTEVGGTVDRRQPAGARLWHLLVGCAQSRPLGIDLRIDLVGALERLPEALGNRHRRHCKRYRDREHGADRHGGSPASLPTSITTSPEQLQHANLPAFPRLRTGSATRAAPGLPGRLPKAVTLRSDWLLNSLNET